MPLDILILRDPRESSAKCSLTPLRGMEGIRFAHFRRERTLDASGRILLSPEGELLTDADRGRGVLLIDCSWRRVGQLLRSVEGEVVTRRLPELATAYPRRSKTHLDPSTGLASIEALYAASVILGERCDQLLDAYCWREEFLLANPTLLAGEPLR